MNRARGRTRCSRTAGCGRAQGCSEALPCRLATAAGRETDSSPVLEGPLLRRARVRARQRPTRRRRIHHPARAHAGEGAEAAPPSPPPACHHSGRQWWVPPLGTERKGEERKRKKLKGRWPLLRLPEPRRASESRQRRHRLS